MAAGLEYASGRTLRLSRRARVHLFVWEVLLWVVAGLYALTWAGWGVALIARSEWRGRAVFLVLVFVVCIGGVVCGPLVWLAGLLRRARALRRVEADEAMRRMEFCVLVMLALHTLFLPRNEAWIYWATLAGAAMFGFYRFSLWTRRVFEITGAEDETRRDETRGGSGV